MQEGKGGLITRAVRLAHGFTSTLENPSQIHVLAVCRDLGLKVFWRDFNEIDGLLVRSETGSFIAVNAARPFVRKRFTIAHEIGHFLMHEGNRFSKLGVGGRQVEREADVFAANLLMPSRMVMATIGLFRSLSTGLDAISEMAWIFRVSHEAMALRLKELKISTENSRGIK